MSHHHHNKYEAEVGGGREEIERDFLRLWPRTGFPPPLLCSQHHSPSTTPDAQRTSCCFDLSDSCCLSRDSCCSASARFCCSRVTSSRCDDTVVVVDGGQVAGRARETANTCRIVSCANVGVCECGEGNSETRGGKGLAMKTSHTTIVGHSSTASYSPPPTPSRAKAKVVERGPCCIPLTLPAKSAHFLLDVRVCGCELIHLCCLLLQLRPHLLHLLQCLPLSPLRPTRLRLHLAALVGHSLNLQPQCR